MAREILFRGKQNSDGKWIEGSLMKVETCGNLYNLIFGSEFREILGTMTAMSHAWVIAETVGQYTGCVDRNGRKIFEGDICRYHDPLISGITNYEVVWFPEGSRWGVRELGSSGIYIDDLDDCFCLRCEVVGTIFDDRT